MAQYGAADVVLPAEHIFWSYRLAKFEVAAERRGVGRLSFANFETDLTSSLNSLADKVGGMADLFRDVDVGKVWVRPKSIVPNVSGSDGRSVIVVPDFAHDHKIASMSVRVLLEPDPLFATSEVMWLRSFGPALDSLLSPGCRGNRLHLQGAPRSIPAAGRRVYRYWAPEYRRFRDGAIDAARTILGRGPASRCILTTLDLTSYYDNIDPSFLLAASFIEEAAESASRDGISFNTAEYVAATTGLLDAYSRFRTKVTRVVGVKRTIGIPIGALTARLVSNLALLELDRFAASQPSVKYYARYVDDILVVEEPDPSEPFATGNAVGRLVPLDTIKTTALQYVLDSVRLGRPNSTFVVQTAKLRVFDLNGEPGLEYLGAVSSDMQRISSERRRFLEPWTEELDHTVMASANTEPVRVLREADALSLRKFAVGTVSDKVSTAAAMLNRDEARKFSRTYLGRPGRLASDWSRWVDLIDVSLRILGAALMSGDSETANEIVAALLERAASLDSDNGGTFDVVWGDSSVTTTRARQKLREWVEEQMIEVICGSTPFDATGFTVAEVRALVDGVALRAKTLGKAALLARARRLAGADLRLSDRETDHAIGTVRVPHPDARIGDLQEALDSDPAFQLRSTGINGFLSAANDAGDAVYRGLRGVELMLMSRPPSYFDVLFRWLRAERPVSGLLDVVNAVRGTRYQTVPMEEHEQQLRVTPPDNDGYENGEPRSTRIILGNLSTPAEWWDASLKSPVHSVERQRRLTRVLNRATDAARRAPGPSLLLLPELSLPRRWIREICLHLGRSSPALALVAGLEYDVVGTNVFNEALAFIPRPFHAAAGWLWTKRRPADHEGPDLRKLGFSFGTRGEKRRFVVVRSEHGAFIPLICSELLEVDTRAALLGSVDLVLVPAWNQDTTSFEYLVHSAPLELHSFIAVANNGFYSDCRIRAPYSVTWQREACRLIARNENEVVFADLDIGDLRTFQRSPATYSEKKRWKPLPPGYVLRKD